MNATITPAVLSSLAQTYASRSDQQAVLLGLLEGLVLHNGRCFPLLSGADMEKLQDAGIIERSGSRMRLRKPEERPLRFTDELCAAFEDATGSKYLFGARDGVAVAELLRRSTEAEVLRRWRLGLSESGWRQCSTVAQLLLKWNDLAATGATVAGAGVQDGDKL
jgi:hypothetical protein